MRYTLAVAVLFAALSMASCKGSKSTPPFPPAPEASQASQQAVKAENVFRDCMRSCLAGGRNQPPDKLCPMCAGKGAGDEFTQCIATDCLIILEAGCKVCCEGAPTSACPTLWSN
jgi:hypothetical protein